MQQRRIQHVWDCVQYVAKLRNWMMCLVFSASSWLVSRQEGDAQAAIKHNKHQLYTSSSQPSQVSGPHLVLNFADPSVLIIASYLLSINWINTWFLSNRCEWLHTVFIPNNKNKRNRMIPERARFAAKLRGCLPSCHNPEFAPSVPRHTAFESSVYTLPTMTVLSLNFVSE